MPSNLAYGVAAAGILGGGALVALALLRSAPKGGCGPNGAKCASDSDCCEFNCSGGVCGGGGTGGGCATDSDCSDPCQRCIGGSCGFQQIDRVVVTQNPGGTQDEVVLFYGGILPLCDWGTLCFWDTANNRCTSNPNVFSFTVQVQDVNGNGIPCITLDIHDTSGLFSIESNPVITDENGYATVNFELSNPYQGGAACPIPPNDPASVSAVGTIDVTVEGTDLVTPVPINISVSITGI